MKAASREAQSHVTDTLDELIRNADNTVAVAAQIGTELFLVVDQLDAERALRVAVADTSLEASQREGIARDVFGNKVAQPTLDILTAAAQQEWSTPREFRAGLVNLGRRALELGAKACRFDNDALGKIAARLAGERLNEKIEEKLGDKVSPELKDALKGLFKR
mgnify:CR=1 FL=1